MSYILADEKPSLDEELLEHYGIKGMKWGVRRDQRTLDRLAGRKVTGRSTPREARREVREAGSSRPRKGAGVVTKRAAWNGRRTSKDIKKARANVRASKKNIDSLKKQETAAKTKAARDRAQKKRIAAEKAFERDNDRLAASQMTAGEGVVAAVLTGAILPVGVVGAAAGGIGAMTVGQLRSQRNANRRDNLLQAEWLRENGRMTTAQLERAMIEFNKKSTR